RDATEKHSGEVDDAIDVLTNPLERKWISEIGLKDFCVGTFRQIERKGSLVREQTQSMRS
ncbi:MAG TPA: hypothetical protein VGK57_19100, partial [Candidatus Binatia bacterium]